MNTDGENYSGYDPDLLNAILSEAAYLLRNLGFAASHMSIIGGVVPSLLVLDPPREAHIGTTDIDICLSLAIIEGDTAEYERIEVCLRKAGYEPTNQTFRWKQTGRLGIFVEFFCPSGETRPAGKFFRPLAAENGTAKQNFGNTLSALALDAGGVLSEDIVEVVREVDLPNGEGKIDYSFRVTNVLGFLIAKIAAMEGRNKPKDAYDIVWILENWNGGPSAVTLEVMKSPAYMRDEVREILERLPKLFESIDHVGARSYLRFMQNSDLTQNDRDLLLRRAVGAVAEFWDSLNK